MSLNRETFVFGYDTPEQREQMAALLEPYMFKKTGVRVTAMSVDHEISRLALIEEAIQRYDDRYDAISAIEEIIACPDLSKWSWEDAE